MPGVSSAYRAYRGRAAPTGKVGLPALPAGVRCAPGCPDLPPLPAASRAGARSRSRRFEPGARGQRQRFVHDDPSAPRLAADGPPRRRQHPGAGPRRGPRLALRDQALRLCALGNAGELAVLEHAGRRRPRALEPARDPLARPRDHRWTPQRADRPLDPPARRPPGAPRARGASLGAARPLGPDRHHASVPAAPGAQHPPERGAAPPRDERAAREGGGPVAAAPRAPGAPADRRADRRKQRAVSVRRPRRGASSAWRPARWRAAWAARCC